MKVRFVTLGCKLNFAESSALGKELLLRIASPKSAKAYIMENNSGNWYDVKNKGVRVGFTTTIAPNSKSTIKVELIPQKK